jgi:hypothetical protein
MRWMMLCAALSACATGGDEPPPVVEEWNHAVAMADCAPWDGPATTVYLTQVPYQAELARPFLRLTIHHGVSEMPGHRWEVGTDHDREGLPWLCPDSGECATARTGWIAFEGREAEDPLRGSYDLTFEDGRRVVGRFVAPVLERPALCG